MDNHKRLEQIVEILKNLKIEDLDDSLIKDNKYPFFYKDEPYRCKMPTQKDIAEAQHFKDKFKMDLLLGEKIYTKEEIKYIIKEKQNVDLDKLEEQRQFLQNKLKEHYIDLSLTRDDNLDSLNKLKEEISLIEDEHRKLFTKIYDYYSPSLESKIEDSYIKYLTCKCTQKCINDKEEWENVWKSVIDFDNDDTSLPSESIKYMTFLLTRTNY